MQCQALQKLLNNAWWLSNEKPERDEQCDMREKLTAHLSSCTLCKKNVIHMARDVFSENALTCEECCLLLPKYYEEMHPIQNGSHLLKTSDIVEIVIHLNSCAVCRTSYRVLAELWDEDSL
ncbi:MAG TPA: hypothetical protein DHW02_20320 [Ktedonobacter sp.]|nr:hypothetical protein [Ktedonobacter sp.]